MAINSWPFETDDTTEVQYARLMDAVQDTGIVSGLTLSAGTGLSVDVAAGAAIIQGLYVEVTGVENVPVDAANASQARRDFLVLRRNFATNQATLVCKPGTPTSGGGSLPSLQQDDSIWEHPIGAITVPAGATNLVSGNLEERHATVTRPALSYRNNTERGTPSRPTIGFNRTNRRLEYFNGSTWQSVTVAWSDVADVPTTPISAGGTGATTAVQALRNLGIWAQPTAPTHSPGRIWIKTTS